MKTKDQIEKEIKSLEIANTKLIEKYKINSLTYVEYENIQHVLEENEHEIETLKWVLE